jgi:hypothetical protein
MEALGRFELPTCGLGNRRSIHLSYRAKRSSLQFTILEKALSNQPSAFSQTACSQRIEAELIAR